MVDACDAWLSGNFAGRYPDVCNLHFEAVNFQRDYLSKVKVCVPANVGSRERAYVFLRYYLVKTASLNVNEKQKIDKQTPWQPFAVEAFKETYPC
jgi:hypothetical protein